MIILINYLFRKFLKNNFFNKIFNEKNVEIFKKIFSLTKVIKQIIIKIYRIYFLKY